MTGRAPARPPLPSIIPQPLFHGAWQVGAALRQLHAFLKTADKSHTWGGLALCALDEGGGSGAGGSGPSSSVMWICPECVATGGACARQGGGAVGAGGAARGGASVPRDCVHVTEYNRVVAENNELRKKVRGCCVMSSPL